MQGTITYSEGRSEEGAFIRGQLFGRGKKIHPDGQVDEGIFRYGRFKQGTTTYHNRTTEEVGAFTEGQLHGEERRTDPDGEVEEGAFELRQLT